MSLELGGKAPLVVFADADVELAARKAVEARLWNCGQVCTCNERTYVHRCVHDAFVERVVELAAQVRVGDPLDEASELGPKVSGPSGTRSRASSTGRSCRAHAWSWAAAAPRAGIRTGALVRPDRADGCAQRHGDRPNEVFGPVLPVVPFDDYDEVIGYANSTVYGLTAYVFTRDVGPPCADGRPRVRRGVRERDRPGAGTGLPHRVEALRPRR